MYDTRSSSIEGKTEGFELNTKCGVTWGITNSYLAVVLAGSSSLLCGCDQSKTKYLSIKFF